MQRHNVQYVTHKDRSYKKWTNAQIQSQTTSLIQLDLDLDMACAMTCIRVLISSPKYDCYGFRTFTHDVLALNASEVSSNWAFSFPAIILEAYVKQNQTFGREREEMYMYVCIWNEEDLLHISPHVTCQRTIFKVVS